MSNRQRWAVRRASIGAFGALALFASSSIADSRPHHGTEGDQGRVARESRHERSPDSGRPSPRQGAWQGRQDFGSHRDGGTRHFEQTPSQGRREPVRQDGWRGGDRERHVQAQPYRSIDRSYGTEHGGRDGYHGADRYSGRYSGGYDAGRYSGRYAGHYAGHDWGYGYRGRSDWHHGRGTFEGRVSRMVRFQGGYRVWLDRSLDPFWIPDARFLLWPLRVGLCVRFGSGWDPAGYYNVYDVGPASTSYDSRSVVQGFVESVDFETGSVAIRSEADGRVASVLLRGDDPRFGELQPGDLVVLSGTWDRDGYFEAFRVEDLRAR